MMTVTNINTMQRVGPKTQPSTQAEAPVSISPSVMAAVATAKKGAHTLATTPETKETKGESSMCSCQCLKERHARIMFAVVLLMQAATIVIVLIHKKKKL